MKRSAMTASKRLGVRCAIVQSMILDRYGGIRQQVHLHRKWVVFPRDSSRCIEPGRGGEDPLHSQLHEGIIQPVQEEHLHVPRASGEEIESLDCLTSFCPAAR